MEEAIGGGTGKLLQEAEKQSEKHLCSLTRHRKQSPRPPGSSAAESRKAGCVGSSRRGPGGLAEWPAAPARQAYAAEAESTHECLVAYPDFWF